MSSSLNGGAASGGHDAQVLRELRVLGDGLNEMKVSFAKLEAGQAAMTQRMDGYDRNMERLSHAIQDFDRFKQGAGVKLGAGVWVATVIGAALVTALVGALVWAIRQQAPPVQPHPVEYRREPPGAHAGP